MLADFKSEVLVDVRNGWLSSENVVCDVICG